ncbi:MAG: hypothetical protein ACRC41_10575 [Sarcina sp.]
MKPRVTVFVIAVIFIGISSAIYIYNRHEKELTRANAIKVAQSSAAPVNINVVKTDYNTINLSQQGATDSSTTSGNTSNSDSTGANNSNNSNNQPNIVINRVS